MSTTTRRLRWRLRRWWDRRRAPWPIVGECHGHLVSLAAAIGEPPPRCAQCREDHEHRWAAWEDAPAWVSSGPGVPVRCQECGARKCDRDGCDQRRHWHKHEEAS